MSDVYPPAVHADFALNPWRPMTRPIDLKHLGKLGEESNELGAAISRCIIQGIDEREPVTGKPNRQWLAEEIADVLANAWPRSMHDQCSAAGVPFFFKQWGEWAPVDAQRIGAGHPIKGNTAIDASGARVDNNSAHSADHPWWAEPGVMTFHLIGKGNAGRTLDGVVHDAMPARGV
jgi:hypothetical protein